MRKIYSHKKLSVFAILSFCVVMFFLCGAVISPEASGSSVDFTIEVSETVLEMNVSANNVSLDLTPINGADIFDEDSVTVTVGTNNSKGYNLSMTAQTALIRNGALSDGSTPAISSLTAPMTESEFRNSTETTSRWGYQIGDGNYMPVKTGINVVSISDVPVNNVTNTVSFGAKSVSQQPAGTYTNYVNFVAVANAEPWYYMQDVDDWAKSVAVGDTAKAVDARTGITYEVIRIDQSYLYMRENLKVPAGTKLTSADSDVSADFTIPTEEWTSSSQNYYCKAIMAVANDEYYYNWYAAKANPYICDNPTANTNATSTNDAKSLGSICPAGWTLPGYANDITSTALWDGGVNPGNLITAGMFAGGAQSNVGANGFWWSERRYNNISAYMLYSYSNGASTTNITKYQGLSVRCASPIKSTVTFDSNGGSEISDPVKTAVMGKTLGNLNYATQPTRDGYVFNGWFTDPVNGEQISNFGFTVNDDITIYAHWEPADAIAGITYMQDFATLSGAEYDSVLNSMTINKPYQVKDSRDGKEYAIARMSNGKLFMLDDLRLSSTTDGGTARVLTSNDSDVSANFTMPIEEWATPNQDYYCKAIMKEFDGGYYYNWYAAKANPNQDCAPLNSNDVTEAKDNESLGSICPAGWTLPTYNEMTPEVLGQNNGTNVAKMFIAMIYDGGNLMGGGSSVSGYYWSANKGTANSVATMLLTNSSGASRLGSPRSMGTRLRCMNGSSATMPKYTITFDANGGTPTTTKQILAGDPVGDFPADPTKQGASFVGWFTSASGGTQISSSTVLTGDVTYYAQYSSMPTYMQDFATMSSSDKSSTLNAMTTNQAYTIKDKRDEKTYSIAKMSNGRVFMLENLKLDSRDSNNAARVLTSTDSDITPANGYTSFTMPTDTWGSQNYQCKAMMAVSGGYYFYNWYAAKANPFQCTNNWATSSNDSKSLGSICPAGWTLPNYSTDLTPDVLWNSGANPAQLSTAPGYFRSGGRYGAGGQGNLWGTDRQGDNWAWFLSVNGGAPSRGYNDKDHGFGVRCILKN